MSDIDEESFGSLIGEWEKSIEIEGSGDEPTVVVNNNNNDIRLVPPTSPPNQMNNCECETCIMMRHNNQKSKVDYTRPIQSIKECGTLERMKTIENECPLVYTLISEFLGGKDMPGGKPKFDPKYDKNQKKEKGSSSEEKEGGEAEGEEEEAGIGNNGEDINDILDTQYDHNLIPTNIICIASGMMGHASPMGTGNIFFWEQLGLSLKEYATVMEQSPKCRHKDSVTKAKDKGKVVTKAMFNSRESGLFAKPYNVNFTYLAYDKRKTIGKGKKKKQVQAFRRKIDWREGMDRVDFLYNANQIARCINNCNIPPEEMEARKDDIEEILREEGLVPQGGRLPPTEEEVYTKLDAIVDVSIILLCVLFTILY